MSNHNMDQKGQEINNDDGLASVIENDYVLSFLNDRAANQGNLFGGMNNNDLPLLQQQFQDQQSRQDGMNKILPQMNLNDNWIMYSINEGKVPYGVNMQQYKVENAEDLEHGPARTKKTKTGKDTGTRKAVESQQSSKNQKANIKNTYINKINSLINDKVIDVQDETSQDQENGGQPPRSDKVELGKRPLDIKKEGESIDAHSSSGRESGGRGMKKVRSYDVLKSDEIEKMNVKLARNRESARNSRKRKKVYIELLEKKVESLTNELATTRKQLELNSNNLNKINIQTQMMNQLVTGRQQLFEKLEKMISNKNDESEVNLLIDSLRLRLGATGKERVNAINYFFKQIVDLLIPIHMKYMLWVATEGKDLFSSKDTSLINGIAGSMIGHNELINETSDYWSQLVTQVNLTENQKKQIVKYRKKLIGEKQKFEQLITNLNNVRKAILKQSNSLQNVIDDFRNILTPLQTGKFLVILNQERNRKEFSAEKLWQSFSLKKETEDGGSDSEDNFLETLDLTSEGGGGDRHMGQHGGHGGGGGGSQYQGGGYQSNPFGGYIQGDFLESLKGSGF